MSTEGEVKEEPEPPRAMGRATPEEAVLVKLTTDVEHEVSELISTLQSGGDLVMVVLRFHLLSENLLERLILANLARGDRIIEKGNLSFVQKLILVDSFDIVQDAAIQALRHLNSLRNKCSHQKGKQVEFSDVETIGRPLGKAFTKIRRDSRGNVTTLLVHTFSKIYTIMLPVVLRLEIFDDLKKEFEEIGELET